jgi:hypothetical protein
MVNWLGFVQLLQTGLRSAVATTLGAFADPREVQAALRPRAENPPLEFQSAGDATWIDYVADTGDGWNSTHSIAWCLSREATLPDGRELPRGQVLVMGGDQVYPTPAKCAYRTHFVDPFRSAFPADVPPQHRPGDQAPVLAADDPMLVATPGNHDWYDGLRGFSQLFCNRQPIGRWRTVQRSSYFALKLAHGWWIWGLDLQLESAIDQPQREYFQALAATLPADARVILCAPEPSWIDESERLQNEARARSPSKIETQTPRFRSLKEIEELLGPRLAMVVAGDLHHYARYAPDTTHPDAPQRITCGGGGAYLLGTHHLPAALQFFVGGKKKRHHLECSYPDAKTSRGLRNKAWRLPTRNKSFCLVLATLYLMFLWLVQSASKVPIKALDNLTLMENLAKLPAALTNIGHAGLAVFQAMAHSPGSVMFALAIVLGGGAFTRSGASKRHGWAFFGGAVHGFIHLLLALALLWTMGRYNLGHLGFTVDEPWQVLLFSAETFAIGGLFGGLLFGIWMVATDAAFGWHSQEVFSSQRIADCKCFLRMRIDADGLTIFPLKLAQACTRWKTGPNITVEQHVDNCWKLRAFPGSGPRFVPVGEAPKLELIEDEIRIAGASAKSAAGSTT